MAYMRNRSCPCARCRMRGLTGAGILVTLGILFLMENYNIVSFNQTWPVLLIVIGLFSFGSHTASTEGHIQPYSSGRAQRAPMYPGQNDPAAPGTAPNPEVKP